jgi:uncharacterized protein YegP (UPF0339 family)
MGAPDMAANVLKFKLFKTRATQPYHWTLNSAGNGQVICTSENYASKRSAIDSINLVFANAGDSKYEDLTGEV